MKTLSKIAAIAAAAAVLAPQAALAATYVSPFESDTTTVTEDFEKIETKFENETWLGNDIGPINVSYWNQNLPMDFVGVADRTDKQGNKALYFKDDNDQTELNLTHNFNVRLEKGDKFIYSFDYASNTKSTFLVMLKSKQCDTKDSFSRMTVEGNDVSNGAIMIIDPTWINMGYSAGIGATYKGSTFTTLKFVIDTCDEDNGGKQTITYYQDGVKGTTFTIYPYTNGQTTENIFKSFDGIAFRSTRGTVPDYYIDNVSYTVEKENKNAVKETFNTAGAFESAGSMWDTSAGDVLKGFGPWDGTNVLKISDASEIDETKVKGDKALINNIAAGQAATYYTGNNAAAILEKGDRYSISFEYCEKNTNQKLELLLNIDDSTQRSVAYNYTSLLKPDVYKGENCNRLFNYANGCMYLFNGETDVWGQGSGFVRYDVIIDTCDGEAGGKQTIAFYRGGTLIDKGLFSVEGSTDEYLRQIKNVGWYIEATAEGSITALDNIWLCKTPGDITVAGDNINGKTFGAGDINVKYERTTVFEQEKPEVLVMAEYDSDGRMTGCKFESAASGERVTSKDFAVADAAALKVFMLDGMNSIKPIVENKVFTAAK